MADGCRASSLTTLKFPGPWCLNGRCAVLELSLCIDATPVLVLPGKVHVPGLCSMCRSHTTFDAADFSRKGSEDWP